MADNIKSESEFVEARYASINSKKRTTARISNKNKNGKQIINTHMQEKIISVITNWFLPQPAKAASEPICQREH